jgi:Flp pilus assembly protein TadD
MPAPYGHSAQWHTPTSVDRLVDLAFAHFAAGRLAEAERSFRGALAIDPRHAECLNGLGLVAHQCGHHRAAIALIGQAIAIDNRVATYHYNIGLVFAGRGRMDEVVKHNRRAVALKPDYADAHTNLAAALSAQGNWGEAVHHFRRALTCGANSPAAFNNIATALLADGKPDEALSILARGLAVQETDGLKNVFALCLRKLRALPKIPGIRSLVERAMAECWARPEEFSGLFTALVKQNNAIAACLART